MTDRRWVRPARLVLLAGSLAFWATEALGAATVVGETLVSSARTGRTTFSYTYTVTLSNTQPALSSATVDVSSSVPSTVVLKSSVSVPAVGAGATLTTTDTFVIQQDRTVAFSWSDITFIVVPGPGPVAQGQITSSAGGTISVTDPGDPILGTQVVIPPGALGDPSDTITIGYADTLPGPLNSNAVAAGVIPVSKVITLDKVGTTPFQKDVQVTIPYSLSALGAPEFPAVVYFNATLDRYEPEQVVSVDQVHGLVTFQTKHFSSPLAVGLPGLLLMAQGKIPWIYQLTSMDTGFRPATNGFEIENFSSGVPGSNGGVCFGVVSYAAWYFIDQPSATPLFANYATASDPGVTPHLPMEDALARELVARTYVDTIADFQPIDDVTPAQTLEEFLLGMLTTNGPQLAYITDTAGEAHSVLLYAWNAATLGFSVYDPNVPAPMTPPPALTWSFFNQSFAPWTSAGTTYTAFWFDAYGTHYADDVLTSLYTSAQAGPITDQYTPGPVSGWQFNTLTITSPLGQQGQGTYPGGPSAPILQVDPVNATVLTYAWNCPLCATANPKPGQPDVPMTTGYLHIYQNNVAGLPLPITNGVPLKAYTAKFSGQSAEMFAFVSSSPDIVPASNDPQGPVSDDYAGFQRVELVQPSVVINVTSTVPGWTGLPTTLTVSGFYVTNILAFEAAGTAGNTCANSTVASGGERGYPLFSASVDPAAIFDGATQVSGAPNGFPYETAGPFPSYNPCSSFFAHEIDSNGNGRVWVNATARGQKFGSFTEDWEYQVRYYSGDPANNHADASCTIGAVPNDDAFSGTPVACTIKCSSALGNISSCTP